MSTRRRRGGGARRSLGEYPSIDWLSVAGYKSVNEELAIQIRPLTVLAGANSSGKSSVIQPLLLLKQTLEATYDPGPLRLDGPNVRFTDAKQLLHRLNKSETLDEFRVCVGLADDSRLSTYFRYAREGLEVAKTVFEAEAAEMVLEPGMSSEALHEQIPERLRDAFESVRSSGPRGERLDWRVTRDRCFLEMRLGRGVEDDTFFAFSPSLVLWGAISDQIRDVIHVPGLRGNPLRTYPVTAVGGQFPGTFERYVASIVADWQQGGQEGKLADLARDLQVLGLTWKVRVRSISDTQVELQVGRLPRAAQGGAWDLVSIADVGFGVSQTLPVLVALRTARRGQVVYLEQPEIHLHPRAQVAMCEVIADAVRRGVKVVVETHSSLLLVGIQTLIARGGIPREEVILHWFERSASGDTRVSSAEVDDEGSFGDWPEDFGSVILNAESAYLNAVSER